MATSLTLSVLFAYAKTTCSMPALIPMNVCCLAKLRSRTAIDTSSDFHVTATYQRAAQLLYFDFISFAQFATISNEMKTAKTFFQEKMGADGDVQIVRRDASIIQNSLLPPAFNEKAGNLIYKRLLGGFEGDTFDVPRPCSPDSDSKCLVEGVNKILQLFVNQGYALNASVEEVRVENLSQSLRLRIRVQGNATLWGMRTLARRGASLLTNFDALVVNSFLMASLRSSSYKIRFTDTYKEELWMIV